MNISLQARVFSFLFLLQSLLIPLTLANDVERLIETMKGETPIINDLRQLTDEIGSRLTGTPANEKSVLWALDKFRQANVSAKTESFIMPRAWVEQEATAVISSKDYSFEINIAAMPFTQSTNKTTAKGQLVNLFRATEQDFKQAKDLTNKWLLVETAVLDDNAGIHGLFQEYVDAVGIENRAEKSGAAGLIYMSSREKNLMYRHLPSDGADNTLPIIVMERESALKAQRLLQNDHKVYFTPIIEIVGEAPYQAENVIAEITGSIYPNEIVLIGAHLDSFDMGTGALDNGSNVSLVIDMARQIKRLNIKPKRTIRFALFNGEEQGIYGSWGYTKRHIKELDQHVITSTIDIGTGKISGFFTNGRQEITPLLNKVLLPVENLGPFEQVNIAVVGTDNYDFMMQGIANLVANQADSNYASNYHAESDTFDKVDQKQLKLNSAIMAAMVLGFANEENIPWQRQTPAQVVNMVKQFDIEASMKTFGLYKSWQNHTRGITRKSKSMATK